MKNTWIKNKNVIITGVSGGLGLSVAKSLIENYGAFVYGVCRNEEKMKKAIATHNIDTTKFKYEVFDVNDKEKWIEFAKKLEEANVNPDVLINNAGIMHAFKKFGDLSDKEINEVINTNFVSHVNATKILLPKILKSATPTVVNVSSSAGMCAVVGESMYSATKYAMRGFTDTLRVDYKGKLTVTGIYPGFIKTDILQRQKEGANTSLVQKMMMPLPKATKKIVKGIIKKKKTVVFGFDGRYLSFFGRLFPHATPSVIRKVLKASKQDIFSDLFE